MKRILECGVLLRLYTMTISALYSYTALYRRDTLAYAVAHADRFAQMTMYGLAVFVVLGMIDLFINDVLPDQFVLSRALHDRHLVSMSIAGCFAVQMSTCVRYEMPYAILPFYAVYVLIVPVSAFVDVRKRYKNNKACQ
jgi:hypothetical protein